MLHALDRVMDALDIETFLYCRDEEEGRELASRLAGELGLPHGDVVFLEFLGIGARVRIRSYLHRPGESYRWLQQTDQENL